MKKLLCLTTILLINILLFSQPNQSETKTIKDSTAPQIQFYFPVSLYSDSVAFEKRLSKLSGEILPVYKEEKKRKYADNVLKFYFFQGNYQKMIDMVDSIQNYDADKSFGIEISSYALAKIKEEKDHSSLEKSMVKNFSEAFNKLPFQKRVSMAGIDSNLLNYFYTEYNNKKTELQKQAKDSLDLDQARSLFDVYFNFDFYHRIYPMISAVLRDPQYQNRFPAIKANKWGGVVPVEQLDEVPDPNLQYKLLFELTGFAMKDQPDSIAKKEMNPGLGEVARQLNLHETNGIPKKNITPVIVVHGSALKAFMTNEAYKRKFMIDNPNMELIKELQQYGVKIIVCGQAMTFQGLEMRDLVPGIKQALTAQTVISSYQLKGFVYYDLSLD